MPDHDERLDSTLEDAMRHYARSADRPTDFRAVAQRAMAAAPRRTGPSWGVLGGIVTVAAAAVLLIALVGFGPLRPNPTPIPVGGPSAVPTASPPVAPSSPAPSSAAPSVAPSASAIPSIAPSASPSASPSSSELVVATEPPTDSPAASPQPTETSGELPAIPSDFDPLSVTFVSPTQGFVLGAVSCGATKCPLVVRTLDAGRTWAEWSGPLPTTVAEGPITAEATTGVSRIRFADTLHGWIYGPELWATSDGGASWAKMTLPKDADGPVQALETARGKVHAVTFVQSSVSFRISSAAVGSADWIVSKAKLDVGAGPVPEVQLVVQGDSGWVLQNDRTVVNGARLVNGAWQPWTPTCADVVGPAFIAGATASDLLASCEVGAWGNPQGTHLFVSTNGGVSSKETGAKVPVTSTTGIASPDGTTIVVSGATDNGAALEATFDRGASWHEVLTLTDEVPVDLGFTTPTQGVVVAVRSSVVSKLYMTRDGGHTWDAVTFQP